MRNIFRHVPIVVAILLALAGAARGQAAPPSGLAPNAATAIGGAATAAPQLQQLVDTLKNDRQRAQLIQQLETLIAAQRAGAPAKPAATPAQGIIEGLAARFQGIEAQLREIAGIADGAPRLVGWVERQAVSPAARTAWLEALVRLIAVFGLGALAGFAAGRALRGLRARFASRRPTQFLKWLALFVAMLVLHLLPIAAFATVATLVLALVHPGVPARPAAMVAIGAILDAQVVLAALWVVLISPATPYFLRAGEETRRYLYIWGRRFAAWGFYGFALAQLALVLGAPVSVDDLVLRLVTIILAGLAIVFVLQNHAAVTAFLRGAPERSAAATGVFRLIRNVLADTWHILAIVYIVGSFGSYLVDLHGGIGFVLRATVASIAVLVVAGIAMQMIHHFDRRGVALGADVRARFPGLQARSNKYLPALVFILSALIYIATLILLLQAWGANVAAWLALPLVRQMLGSLVSIAIVVVIAVILWEVISAAVERALGAGDTGRHVQVSARMRTLLPLARSTVLIAIVTMAAFVVLAQLGVNIAPLLAGAGIIGIAVGFGSQQLVHDIINGLFILIENTITVGDWVDVGGGHAGAVEEISIRTMRLRDGAGAVHTIPFSSVTAVTNTNRGIGNAAVGVNVAFGEDTDRVARILAELAAGMRRDANFSALMLSDFQLWGVDKVDGSTVTLAGQIVCTDGGRWPVQREFNRRVMLRFQEEGISFALPTQSVIVRQAGQAPERRPETDPHVTALRAPRDRG